MTLRLYLPFIALALSGCATPPVVIREPMPVPEACLMPCPFSGPEQILTNGQLLEAYRGRLEQVGCYESRLVCVRESAPKSPQER